MCAVLEFEDLHEVVLVGHSYGGAVISGAAGQLPARVAHLVCLDADVSDDGEAVMDLLPPAERSAYEDRPAGPRCRHRCRPGGGRTHGPLSSAVT